MEGGSVSFLLLLPLLRRQTYRHFEWSPFFPFTEPNNPRRLPKDPFEGEFDVVVGFGYAVETLSPLARLMVYLRTAAPGLGLCLSLASCRSRC